MEAQKEGKIDMVKVVERAMEIRLENIEKQFKLTIDDLVKSYDQSL